MTERERALDALVVEMADGLCKLLNPKHPTSAENFADGIANATEVFREASEKQWDHDRNGARRAMGKADCAKPKTIRPCGVMMAEGCKRCPDTDCKLREVASGEDKKD